MPKNKTKMRGLTTVEALLIAAAFIIVGVVGLLTFQGMGKSAAESLRANAIATADGRASTSPWRCSTAV
jgi:Tfp pilus assembly protein PilV